MTEPIKEYLDAQAEKDEALKAKYNPEQIEKCVEYINKKAEEIARNSGFVCGNMRGVKIEDAVVYKWARDYFIEDIATKEAEKKEPEKKNAEPPAAPKTEEPSKPKEELEIKPAITTKKAEKKQPEQSWLFDFGD